MEIKSCENDTKALLEECSAGSKMAIESVDEMIGSVENKDLKKILTECRRDHEKTGEEADKMLHSHGSEEGHVPPIARAMSWMKVNLKVTGEKADSNAAAITYDGCAMGVRTISKCINENPDASRESLALAKEIVALEKKVMDDIRPFL